MTDTEALQQIAQAGWTFPEDVWRGLSDYEKSFVVGEFTGRRTRPYYTRRLRAIGFTGMDRVLDCACGMGQWALCLAEANGRVDGIDANADRLGIAQALTAAAGRTNCTFQTGHMERLPYDDATFDGIFCYGAFMFADMPATLAEFHRVLRPGGRLYLNANSAGWYAHLLIDRGLARCNLRIMLAAVRMILRTCFRCRSNRVVGARWLKKKMVRAGFRILVIDSEGGICVAGDDADKPEPAYPRSFYGLPALIEVLAQKH